MPGQPDRAVSQRPENNPRACKAPEADDFDLSAILSEQTGTKIPAPLASLRDKTVRFTGSSAIADMEQRVYDMLGI